jgi:hypothetical protein
VKKDNLCVKKAKYVFLGFNHFFGCFDPFGLPEIFVWRCFERRKLFFKMGYVHSGGIVFGLDAGGKEMLGKVYEMVMIVCYCWR